MISENNENTLSITVPKIEIIRGEASGIAKHYCT